MESIYHLQNLHECISFNQLSYVAEKFSNLNLKVLSRRIHFVASEKLLQKLIWSYRRKQWKL